jgi:hypothetical protein
MRRRHGCRWIVFEGTLKLGMGERRTKVSHGFPHRIVQEDGASRDALMQLRRNIAGLLLHPIRIRLPCLEKGWNIPLCNLEDIHQDDGGDIGAKLLEERNVRIKWSELEHLGHPLQCIRDMADQSSAIVRAV